MNLLEKAQLLEREASEFGFEWENAYQIIAQIKSECVEVCEHLGATQDKNTDIRLQEEIGDLLHAVLSLCVFCNYNPTETLENSLVKFEKRLKMVKEIAKEQGHTNLSGHSFEALMSIWDKAKKTVG